MAQEAALEERANRRLRRVLAHNESFSCADVKFGDAVLYYRTAKKRARRVGWGPAPILDVDEAGGTGKFQPKTFKVACFCARGKAEAEDVAEADVDPRRTRVRYAGLDLGNQQEQVDVELGTDVDGEDGNCTSSTGVPESEPGPKPEAIPVPDPPFLSVQLPSPRGSLEKRPDLVSPRDKICEPSQAPKVNRTRFDGMTCDQLHDECSQRAFRRKKLEAVLETRLTRMDAAEEKRNL